MKSFVLSKRPHLHSAYAYLVMGCNPVGFTPITMMTVVDFHSGSGEVSLCIVKDAFDYLVRDFNL